MEFSRKKNFYAVFFLALPFLLYFCFVPILPALFNFTDMVASNYQYAVNKVNAKDFVYKAASVSDSIETVNLEKSSKKLENPPDILKAMYITGWSAGSKNYLNYLHELLKITQINAVVIDVKDASGIVSYKTSAKKAKEYRAYHSEIPDVNDLVKKLHDQGIYVIGRIAVFEDPMLAQHRPNLAVYDKSKTTDSSLPVLWQDSNGLSWVDPASKEVWDYNIEIAKDALSHGFDEINFDYVRFPTDGNMDDVAFPVWDSNIPKHIIIKSFFKKLRESLPDAKISADLFGQTTTNTDDMGIGQIFEDSLGYFDYVCPMIYPSHYAEGFIGYKNPADHPYQVITYSLNSALARQKVYAKINEKLNPGLARTALAKIRPWIQDFDLGALYDADMVKQEIKAVINSMGEDFDGYMLWNPSNYYTKEAITKEDIMSP